MSNYIEFYNKLNKYNMITPVYKHLLSLIDEEINISGKDEILILFAIYFSLLSDGNIGMSLDKQKLLTKWETKVNATLAQVKEQEDINKDKELNEINEINEIRLVANDIINNQLNEINEDNLSSIIGENKMFVIDNNWLYATKYDKARKSLLDSINRLFNKTFPVKKHFSYHNQTEYFHTVH